MNAVWKMRGNLPCLKERVGFFNDTSQIYTKRWDNYKDHVHGMIKTRKRNSLQSWVFLLGFKAHSHTHAHVCAHKHTHMLPKVPRRCSPRRGITWVGPIARKVSIWLISRQKEECKLSVETTHNWLCSFGCFVHLCFPVLCYPINGKIVTYWRVCKGGIGVSDKCLWMQWIRVQATSTLWSMLHPWCGNLVARLLYILYHESSPWTWFRNFSWYKTWWPICYLCCASEPYHTNPEVSSLAIYLFPDAGAPT